jgi:hypothetical protein
MCRANAEAGGAMPHCPDSAKDTTEIENGRASAPPASALRRLLRRGQRLVRNGQVVDQLIQIKQQIGDAE